MLDFMPKGRYSRRALSVSFLLALLIFLPSCVLRKFFANKLDWVIVYQLDSYYDLNDEQDNKLKTSLQGALDWLRRERSPAMLALIQKLEKEAEAKKIPDDSWDQANEEIGRWRKDLEPHLLQPFADFGLSLSKKQIDHFAKKLKKSNEDLQDLVDEDDDDFPDAVEDAVEKRVKQVEYWYGKLTKDQKKIVEDNFRFSRKDALEQLRQRKRLHEFMLKALESKDQAAIKTFLQNWFRTGEAWTDEEYLRYRKGNANRWERTMNSLNKTLSDSQWKTLQGRLKEIEEDVRRFQKG